MSINKRKTDSPAKVGKSDKKAKLEAPVSKPVSAPAPVSKPVSADNKKLSKKKEKRKLFKKELKKKLLKDGKLNWVTKKRKKPKMTEIGGDKTVASAAAGEAVTAATAAAAKSARSAPPKKPQEISANWKALQRVLQKEENEGGRNKKKKKKKVVVGDNKKEKLSSTVKTVDKKDPEVKKTAEKPEIWFEIDDANLLEHSKHDDDDDMNKGQTSNTGRTDKAAEETSSESGKKEIPTGLTGIVGLDCEMVGVGEDGSDSILARVSIVNQHGHPVYDKYVKPTETVTDYRTEFSGIRPHNLRDGALPFKTVQAEVAEILKNRILVGHSLTNDLQVLFLSHHHRRIRDTQKYKPFKKLCGGMPSLKKLASTVLSVSIQSGEHSSVEDAQTAIRLYMMHRLKWEKEMKDKKMKGKTQKAQDAQK